MTAEIGGGKVVLGVEGDTSGFAAELQAKLDAAAENLRVRIPVEADTSGFAESVEAAAHDAGGVGVTVSLSLEDDAADRLKAQVDAAMERLGDSTVSVEMGLAAGADERLKERVDAAVATSSADVDVGLSLKDDAEARLRAEVAAATDAAGVGEGVNVSTDDGGAAAGSTEESTAAAAGDEAAGASAAAESTSELGGVSLMAAAAMLALAGGLSAVVGIAGAAVGAIAPLAGLLAALPAAFAVGGAAMGTLFAGLHGVMGAVSDLDKQQQTSSQTAMTYADQQHAAAERVLEAHQSLANAIRAQNDSQIRDAQAVHSALEQQASTDYNVSQQRIEDARAVAEAEYNLQTAELSETQAQQQLTQARQQAILNLQQLGNAVTDAHLSAQGAQLAVQEAQQQLDQVLADPNATALQREQAELALKQARQQLIEATEGVTNAEKANNTAKKQGVEGNPSVVSAEEQVRAARHAEMLATEALSDAEKKRTHDAVIGAQQVRDAETAVENAMRAQREGAQQSAQAIANAQRQLADAEHAQTEAVKQTGTAAQSSQEALDQLTPAGRKFAEMLHGLINGPLQTLQHEAQNALLPGLGRAVEDVLGSGGVLPLVGRIMTATGHAIASVAQELAGVIASPATRSFLTELAPQTHRIILAAGDGVAHLAGVARDFAQAALPLIDKLAHGFDEMATHLDRVFSSRSGMNELRQFFDQVYTTTHAWGQILGSVGGALLGILKAAAPAGNDLNTAMEGVAQHFDEWVNSAGGQQRIQQFFQSAVPVAKALGNAIRSLVDSLLKVNNNAGFARVFTSIAQVAPHLIGLLQGFGGRALTGVGAFVSGLGTIARLLGPLGPTFGSVAGKAVVLYEALFAFGKLKGVFTTLAGAVGHVGDVLRASKLLLIGGEMRTNASSVEKAAATMRNSLVALFRGGELSEGAGVIEKAATRVHNSIAGILTSSGDQQEASLAKRLVTGVGNAISSAAGGIKAKAAQIGSAIASGITGKVTTASKEAGAAAEAMGTEAAAGAETATVAEDTLAGSTAAVTVAEEAEAVAATEADVAMDANPIGLIVLAIAGLVTGIIELVKHWRGVWTAMKDVGGWIKTAFVAVWHALGDAFDWVRHHLMLVLAIFTGPLFPLILAVKEVIEHFHDIVHALGDVFMWLWQNAIQPAWDGIKTIIVGAWNDVLKPIVDAQLDVWKALGDVFMWLWHNVAEPVWDGIKKVVGWAWDGIKGYFDFLKDEIHAVADIFTWLWHNVVEPVWDGIVGAIKTAVGIIEDVLHGIEGAFNWLWQHAVKPVFDFITGAAHDVANFFEHTFMHAIGSVLAFLVEGFQHVGDAFLSVVKWMMNTAASSFGWVPGIGGDIKNAAKAVDLMSASVDKVFTGWENELRGWGESNKVPSSKGLGHGSTDTSSIVEQARSAGAAFEHHRHAALLHRRHEAATQRAGADASGAAVEIHYERGSVTVNNPTREPGSDSIAKRARRATIMHLPPHRVRRHQGER